VDGVLMRIEVKSLLTKAELRSAVRAAGEIYDMEYSRPWDAPPPGPVSAV
jgi:hypothetical protein